MTDIPVFQIDSGVPVPEDRYTTLPLDKLEVGESFVFPLEKRQSIATTASRLKRVRGKTFTIKKQDDKTARVWRTE